MKTLTFFIVIFSVFIFGSENQEKNMYDVVYYYSCELTNDAGEVEEAYDIFLEVDGEEVEIYLFPGEFNGEESITLTTDQINERRIKDGYSQQR